MTKRVIATLQEFSLPLIAGVVAALVWANLDPHHYEAFVHWSPLGHGNHLNTHFVINDIFMALFFGIAAKEIAESVLPGGPLNPPRKAVNPLMGTLGGVVGPVAVYFIWVAVSGASEIANGWGIPTATDIALAWLVARVAFGKGHPAVSFLLLLAVADDALGLAIIAVFYPDPTSPVAPIWLLMVAGAMSSAYVMRKRDVKNFWAYLLVPGVLSWTGLFMAHLHPALALVVVVPFMPSAGHDAGLYAEGRDGHHRTDTLNRFEHAFKLPVDFGLFGFGLANAGVALSSVGDATWGVLGALLIGKTVGIFGFSYAAERFGFSLPAGMTYRSLFVAGIVASLGLTVALFVAGTAFTDPVLQGAAKMGALLSAVAAPLAIGVSRVIGAHKIAKSIPPEAEPKMARDSIDPMPA